MQNKTKDKASALVSQYLLFAGNYSTIRFSFSISNFLTYFFYNITHLKTNEKRNYKKIEQYSFHSYTIQYLTNCFRWHLLQVWEYVQQAKYHIAIKICLNACVCVFEPNETCKWVNCDIIYVIWEKMEFVDVFFELYMENINYYKLDMKFDSLSLPCSS